MLVGTLGLCLASALLTPGLQRGVAGARARYGAGQTNDVLRARNQSAFAVMLGEVRATASDLMFIKTTRYTHAGVAYAPRLNLDSLDESKRFAKCGAGTPTAIRSVAEDFRGFLGNIEREVKPYRDASKGHRHTEATEVLPWFRLMTLANPNFIRGYRVGATTLLSEKEWEKGLAFINEGIAGNPENPELFLLYQTLALFHLRGRSHDDYPWGEQWLENALTAAREAFELGRLQRPRLGRAGEKVKDLSWTPDMEDDFCFVAHIIPLLLRKSERLDEALRFAREIEPLMPDYGPLGRMIKDMEAELKTTRNGAVP
ncbi:hypothetical protein ACFL34_01450 [Candidatus Sumerlaeota bacterium]